MIDGHVYHDSGDLDGDDSYNGDNEIDTVEVMLESSDGELLNMQSTDDDGYYMFEVDCDEDHVVVLGETP